MRTPAIALLLGALAALPSAPAAAHSEAPSFATLAEGEAFRFVRLWHDEEQIDHPASHPWNDAPRGQGWTPEWIGRPWQSDHFGRPDFWQHDRWHEHHGHLPPVPEPAGAALFGAGLALVAWLKRRVR